MKKNIIIALVVYVIYTMLTLLIFYLNGMYIWTTLPSSLVLKRIILVPLFLTVITLLNVWLFKKRDDLNHKKIIISTLLTLIVLGFIMGIIDYNRVKSNKMPIFVISEIDKSGPEINYYGLNYKIVRNPRVSYKNDISHDVYVKFGFWFYTWVIVNNKTTIIN